MTGYAGAGPRAEEGLGGEPRAHVVRRGRSAVAAPIQRPPRDLQGEVLSVDPSIAPCLKHDRDRFVQGGWPDGLGKRRPGADWGEIDQLLGLGDLEFEFA